MALSIALCSPIKSIAAEDHAPSLLPVQGSFSRGSHSGRDSVFNFKDIEHCTEAAKKTLESGTFYEAICLDDGKRTMRIMTKYQRDPIVTKDLRY